ncbi:MAG: hypothetical protein IPL33_12550 [Sphingobacteriales bacterium]|nr:hypothetical protein [Sphingobacteriales bacterium]
MLLISANFIASDYIWDIELKRAVQRHENGEAVVIPIFCKPCDYEGTSFEKLAGLPRNGTFISTATNRDAVGPCRSSPKVFARKLNLCSV